MKPVAIARAVTFVSQEFDDYDELEIKSSTNHNDHDDLEMTLVIFGAEVKIDVRESDGVLEIHKGDWVYETMNPKNLWRFIAYNLSKDVVRLNKALNQRQENRSDGDKTK